MKLFIIAFFSIIPSLSYAWFHFEPAIGYNKGQFDSSSMSGLGLNLKLGFDIKEIFIVADADYHNVQQGSLSSVTYNDQGVTLGLNLQRYRLWYGLITSSTLSYSSGSVSSTETGTGTKLGVSSLIGTELWVNLEARFINYTNLTTGGVSSTPSDLGTVGYISLSYTL